MLGATPEATKAMPSSRTAVDQRRDDAEPIDEAADADRAEAEADHGERIGQGGVGPG